jgi:hypothetical protein
MQFLGKVYTRAEIERYTGTVAQIGGTRAYELSDGPWRGTRAIDVETGAGLRFTVLPDRGMDISAATFRGINLVYRTPSGEVHPSHYTPVGNEWIRTFFAGLLTTCGLTTFGPPGEEAGESLPLHGRMNVTPARSVQDRSGWAGDDYVVELLGTVEESAVFGPRMRLERTIRARLGEARLTVEDTVTNFGRTPSPFVILYHINPGFPLLDSSSELLVASRSCAAYEEYARGHEAEAYRFPAPQPGWREQDFLHTVASDRDGRALVAFVSPDLEGGLGLWVRYDAARLPYLTEWKMVGEGDYVVGVEPCNAPVLARADLRARGLLPSLGPGEKVSLRLEIGVAAGGKEIAALRRGVEAAAAEASPERSILGG